MKQREKEKERKREEKREEERKKKRTGETRQKRNNVTPTPERLQNVAKMNEQRRIIHL